jgi:hypothetical protein
METQEKLLAYWINERELIRLRRQSGESPTWAHGWHTDPHMGTVRYCNVRREDDKVTKWLAQYWRPQYHEVWQILLARLINNIPTLEKLLELAMPLPFHGALPYARGYLKEVRKNGPIFGNAYTVSTNGYSMDKVDYIIDRVLKPAVGKFDPACTDYATLETTCRMLCGLNGVSTFLAGQIIADLKNTAGHPLRAAPDWHTWAAPGPGSLRGLEAFYGRRVTASGFAPALAQCWQLTRPLLKPYLHDLHMQDFQNCLCEFSKFMRVRAGGHARNRYNANTASAR